MPTPSLLASCALPNASDGALGREVCGFSMPIGGAGARADHPDYGRQTRSGELVPAGRPLPLNAVLASSSSKHVRSSRGFLQGTLVPSVLCRHSLVSCHMLDGVDRGLLLPSSSKHPNEQTSPCTQ